MTRDQHDHVKRKDINKTKKRLSRLNTNRRIALYRLLGQYQEEILDIVRISNLCCDYEIDEQSKYPFIENYKFKVSNSNIK